MSFLKCDGITSFMDFMMWALRQHSIARCGLETSKYQNPMRLQFPMMVLPDFNLLAVVHLLECGLYLSLSGCCDGRH